MFGRVEARELAEEGARDRNQERDLETVNYAQREDDNFVPKLGERQRRQGRRDDAREGGRRR